MSPLPHPARAAWQVLEPLHAVVYFAPEVAVAVAATGLRGWWRGYFAGRAAPLGAVSAAPVTALFANFAPAMVARALPSAWEVVAPADVLAARVAGVGDALARLLAAGDPPPAPEVLAAVDEAADAVDLLGRPLAAAWAEARRAGPVPADPWLRLWWAATVLREHRGDAHVAALADAGLDGCEAHLTMVGTGAVPAEVLRPNRGWTEDEWAAAAGRLTDRGLLDAAGRLTRRGAELRSRVEARTDEAAGRPWATLAPGTVDAVVAGLRPAVATLLTDRAIPVPNPIGWSPGPS